MFRAHLGMLFWLFASLPACASTLHTAGRELKADPSIRRVSEAPYRGQTEIAGRPVAWEYHFNANAIRGFGLSGSKTGVAITASGHLLAFVLDGGVQPRITKQRILAAPATTIEASSPGALLVGTQDGRIWRVDPRDLELSLAATVHTDPRYIARRADGAVVVVSWGDRVTEDARTTERVVGHTTVTSVVSKGRTTIHDGPPGSTFMLDSQGRLWIGADAGEWGGYHRFLDTRSGRLSPEMRSSGVYGFAEAPDGRIFAFGGLIHMGMVDTFIDTIAPIELDKQPKVHGLPPKHRIVPITGIVMPAPSGPWFVTTHVQLFRTGPALRRLDYVGLFELRNFWGRPDSVGSYPAAGQMAPVSPDRVLLGTRRDGLVVLDLRDASIEANPLPNQLDAGRVVGVLDTTSGPVVTTYDFGPYHWDGKRWTTLDPYRGHELDYGVWYEYGALRTPAGGLVTVGADNSGRGVRLGLAWRAPDSPERLFLLDDCDVGARGAFMSPSGELLGFESDYDVDKRFLVEITASGLRRLAPGPTKPYLFSPVPIWSDGTRTLVMAGSEPVLAEVVHEGDRWSYAIVHEPTEEEDLDVTDTLAEDRRVLLATRRGVLAFDPDQHRLEPFEFPFEHPRITSLERDAGGHLWLGAGGLKVVHGGRPVAVTIPGVLNADSAIQGLTALSDGRIAVSLGQRGLLLLSPLPAAEGSK